MNSKKLRSAATLSPMNTATTPQDLLEKHSSELAKLCQTYNVHKLELFGSAARQSDYTENSDIDLLVTFAATEKKADKYFGLLTDLETLFGKKVDLIEEKALRNPYVIKTINQDKKTLYVAP